VKAGAKLVVDGRGLAVPGREKGFFLGGSLFDKVSPEMRIYKEETPSVPCRGRARPGFRDRARPGEQARVRQRDRDLHPRWRHGKGVRAPGAGRHGGRERAIPVPMAFHSFGGWKQSLFGDHHAHGPEAVRFYTTGEGDHAAVADHPGGAGVFDADAELNGHPTRGVDLRRPRFAAAFARLTPSRPGAVLVTSARRPARSAPARRNVRGLVARHARPVERLRRRVAVGETLDHLAEAAFGLGELLARECGVGQPSASLGEEIVGRKEALDAVALVPEGSTIKMVGVHCTP